MGAFELMDGEYEQVVYNHDPVSGLKAIIAIHSTALGPALGGTRFYPYATEDDALRDVLRLARGMSYKAAAAGLDLGGGKAVIIGDPKRIKTEALLRAHGRFVESLAGRYITAEDVGTFSADMDVVARETRFVTGRSILNGGGGDPSLNTAYGVLRGMQAVADELWQSSELAGRHVVVQGVGKVGYELCRLLHEAAVPGSANNVLARLEHGRALRDLGILYAPDYVINAGGLINVADELRGYSPERARARVEGIFGALRMIFHRAKERGVPTAEAADRLAEERMREVSRIKLVRVSPGLGSAPTPAR